MVFPGIHRSVLEVIRVWWNSLEGAGIHWNAIVGAENLANPYKGHRYS